jgi:hypothetical protein
MPNWGNLVSPHRKAIGGYIVGHSDQSRPERKKGFSRLLWIIGRAGSYTGPSLRCGLRLVYNEALRVWAQQYAV